MKPKGQFNFLPILVAVCMLTGFAPVSPVHGEDCEKAREYHEKALSMEKVSNDPGDLAEKERLYREAIGLCPDFADAHNNLGNMYENAGKYTEAIAEYLEAVKLRPDMAAPYAGLGDVYFKQGDYQEAVKWYDRALGIDPKDEETRRGRMRAEAMTGKNKVVAKEDIVVALSRETRGLDEVAKVAFSENSIPFDYNSSQIRDDAKTQLKELGQALVDPALSEYGFEIDGHTDSRGSDEYNRVLSLRRANAVKDYLVSRFQISPDRLKAMGYGKSRLIATGSDEASQARNRRVEIARLGKIEAKVAPPTVVELESGSHRVALDVGFYYQDGQTGRRIEINPDGRTVLRPGKDLCQVFFRPARPCYVYLLRKDAAGKWEVLFPVKESSWKSNPVSAGKEYWVSCAVGEGDGASHGKGSRGSNKIYLIASRNEIKEIESSGPNLDLTIESLDRSGSRGLSTIVSDTFTDSTAPSAGGPSPDKKSKPQGSNGPDGVYYHVESDGTIMKSVSFVDQ